MIYNHSPKVIVIAGGPASGKTATAHELCKKYGYYNLSLDGINCEVASKLKIQIADLRQPYSEIAKEFKSVFLEKLRSLRYVNIVIEGCRISHVHIFQSFVNTLFSVYGDYTLLKCFYLNPPLDVRQKQYLLRQAQLAKKVAKYCDANALKSLEHQNKKGFCEFLEPPLPGFDVVECPNSITMYASSSMNQKHPDLPIQYESLLKSIAESGTHNPFYQRVEIGNVTLIRGFTSSEKSWFNINKLHLDLKNKSVCDIGCMHGYFTFKIEEAGANPIGIDKDSKAISVANMIAKERHSYARFAVHNCDTELYGKFDIIFALNVLHRVSNFEDVCKNIFNSSNEVVLEVGEIQIKKILLISNSYGYRIKKSIKSHRNSDVVGQQVIIYFVKKC
jgi:cytidylate kinase